MQTVRAITTVIEIATTIVFASLLFYQIFYTVFILFTREKELPLIDHKQHTFGVIVSARNEEQVIAQFIDSIRKQDYPQELVRIFVVADNCTDQTAQVCRDCGAHVLERFDTEHIGKGYALDLLFAHLREIGDDCDAYVIFDADNLVDKRFLAEMSNGLNRGFSVLTSYRNSKNFGTNWLSSGCSLWFLREAKFLNYARMRLHTSCAVSGTGFCVTRETIEKNGGWPYHLLTEDMEFTVNTILAGGKVGYCGKAILYDEQPSSFWLSWNQRLRWTRGFYQVLMKYGGRLFLGMLRGCFACFDMIMTILPGIIGFISFLCSIADSVYWIMYPQGNGLEKSLTIIGIFALMFYLTMFLMGFFTMMTEGHNISGCSTKRKVWSVFTFPIYMFTYIPIGIVAVVKRVKWKPIPHTVSKSIEDLSEETATK